MNNLKDAIRFYDSVCASSEDEKIAIGHDHHDYIHQEMRKAAIDYDNLIDGLIAGTGSLWPAEINDYCNRLLNDIGYDEDHPRRIKWQR